jgi:hypothetical protein
MNTKRHHSTSTFLHHKSREDNQMKSKLLRVYIEPTGTIGDQMSERRIHRIT